MTILGAGYGRATMRKGAVALLCAFLLCPTPGAAERIEKLRVCADPDNLPFSSDRTAGERGLYIELAELVGARLGVPVEYFWWRSYFGKRTVRSTLLADECDAFFGLPADKGFMSQSVALTRPFLEMGYVVIRPPALALSSLDDLKGRRVAVEFASPPQMLLSEREGHEMVTFRRVEEALDALARREVDAAFVWGPVAGYYNKTKLGGAYLVSPVAGSGLQWQAAVGVRKGRDGLRTAIDAALEQMRPDIARLADKYGLPSGPAVGVEAAGAQQSAEPRPREPAADSAAPAPAAELARAGRSLFNQHCSHCHAPNAMSPEPSRDLRRLRARYGEKMREVAYATVREGRPTKGMPTWGDALSPEAIRQIIAFLESVQD